MMSPLFRRPIAGFALLAFAVCITFYSSARIRDWFHESFVRGNVVNAPPLPVFAEHAIDSTRPALRFFAVGDAGTGGHGQRTVAQAMGRQAEKIPVDFVLFLGDNFYEWGVESVHDDQWTTKFDSMYTAPSLQIPFYAVLGNHDYKGNPQAQVDYTRQSNRWRMPSRYYSFSEAVDESTTIEFFCLDTEPMSELSAREIARGEDSAAYMPQLRWLKNALTVSRARWKVAVGHHPLYSNGYHGNNPGLALLLEPLFDKGDVHFYIAGHDHDLQLLMPVRGTHHVISGGGGKQRSVEWRENTIFAATNLGFVLFEISYSDVTIQFFNKDGQVRYIHTISFPTS